MPSWEWNTNSWNGTPSLWWKARGAIQMWLLSGHKLWFIYFLKLVYGKRNKWFFFLIPDAHERRHRLQSVDWHSLMKMDKISIGLTCQLTKKVVWEMTTYHSHWLRSVDGSVNYSATIERRHLYRTPLLQLLLLKHATITNVTKGHYHY